jgi:hypothetical protein
VIEGGHGHMRDDVRRKNAACRFIDADTFRWEKSCTFEQSSESFLVGDHDDYLCLADA